MFRVHLTQSLNVWVNATANCQVYVCKRKSAALKLSNIIAVQAGKVSEVEVALGMGGVNADLELCKIGDEKVVFSEYRVQFLQ
jgi:hypothetical protein